MASKLQIKTAQKNIKKAQKAWKSMSGRQRALAQPEGRDRAKPGTKGEGDYYRIIVRPKNEFTSFRYQDVGRPGHIQRLTGRRSSGSWATHAWLISKSDAHQKNGALMGDSADAEKILENLGSVPVLIKGDLWKAKDHPNVPESVKPTLAQRKARKTNIKKAQQARKIQSRIVGR